MIGPSPSLAVRTAVPDLRPVAAGNALPGVWTFASGAPGPHVVLVSLVHGNEFAGAVVLARWLRAGLRPSRGRLTLVFANLGAFARFDPVDPTLSRYLDEDLNRLWRADRLDGARDSAEARRARELRPVIESADVLLDLHSMLWPSDPLVLSGGPPRARALAATLGTPAVVVAEAGHPEGGRLLDHAPFAEPFGHRTALLVEGGEHWEDATVATLEAAAAALLRATGVAEPPAAPAPRDDGAPTPPAIWDVTRAVLATTRAFAFVAPFRGGTVIPAAGTLIARDGPAEIRTPHDDCMLVMPTPRILRGHVAVRLARRAGEGA